MLICLAFKDWAFIEIIMISGVYISFYARILILNPVLSVFKTISFIFMASFLFVA